LVCQGDTASSNAFFTVGLTPCVATSQDPMPMVPILVNVIRENTCAAPRLAVNDRVSCDLQQQEGDGIVIARQGHCPARVTLTADPHPPPRTASSRAACSQGVGRHLPQQSQEQSLALGATASLLITAEAGFFQMQSLGGVAEVPPPQGGAVAPEEFAHMHFQAQDLKALDINQAEQAGPDHRAVGIMQAEQAVLDQRDSYHNDQHVVPSMATNAVNLVHNTQDEPVVPACKQDGGDRGTTSVTPRQNQFKQCAANDLRVYCLQRGINTQGNKKALACKLAGHLQAVCESMDALCGPGARPMIPGS